MARQADWWSLTYAAGANVRLCDACERAPAVVTCKADSAKLCATCDADVHAANPLSCRHERLPVPPFYEPATTWQKEMVAGADLSFFAYADPFLDLEYADNLVPATGGPPPAISDIAIGEPVYNTYNGDSMSHSISSSEVGVVPAAAAAAASISDWSNPHSSPIRYPMATVDREARVMRYREKRKNRKFEKTIRYASRKAYAESRPRIKGRFAKRVEASDADPIYSFADDGYGVVPSF